MLKIGIISTQGNLLLTLKQHFSNTTLFNHLNFNLIMGRK